MIPRSVDQRIEWFRSNKPSAVGMCLRHTWLATRLPSVGMPDANAGVAYVKKHGKLQTDRDPPRGAWVWWTSSTHGHVAISLGDHRIVSTDVNGPATTGTVHLSYPEQMWNHTYQGWSAWYGEPFGVKLTDGELRDRRHRLRRKRDRWTDRIRAVRTRLRRVRDRLRGR